MVLVPTTVTGFPSSKIKISVNINLNIVYNTPLEKITLLNFKHQSMMLSVHINNGLIILWLFSTYTKCAITHYFNGAYYFTDKTTFWFFLSGGAM